MCDVFCDYDFFFFVEWNFFFVNIYFPCISTEMYKGMWIDLKRCAFDSKIERSEKLTIIMHFLV